MVEVGTLTFARLTSLRCGAAGASQDLLAAAARHRGGSRTPADDDYDREQPHFYGWCVDVDSGGSIWLQRSTHVSERGGAGLHVGPVKLRPTIGPLASLPREGSVVVGHLVRSPRGPMLEWWCHGAEPVLAFCRAARTGRVRATNYADLRLPPSIHDTPDDLWCLARILICGQFTLLTDGQTRHPERRDGHVRARGVRVASDADRFVWLAALLVRDASLVGQYERAKGAPAAAPWTASRLESILKM